MARQEIASTFGDGLMMDLNPINTPKSVLTDCLNGTYITYNGNEFVLQNDMGNYKLKNCKLPTNFIPVGVKGYGDILYIVSYNPITKETEIGSYPAPQSIFTTGDSEALLASEDDLTPFKWGPETEIQETEVEYPDIIKTNKKPIFIFNGPDEETYKLNPGDEFRFSGSVDIPTFIYQHLNFYIIDEDNKLYDIDDTQIYHEDGTLVSPDLRKVFWETPGWLAAQYDLYVPDKFNLNLRSLNVPEFLVAQSDEASSQAEDTPLDELQPDEGYFKVSMDLSSQTIITDKLFQTELNKHFGNIEDNLNTNMSWEKNPANVYDHLYIRYLIKRNIDPPDVGEDDYGTFKGIVVSLDDMHTQDYINGVTEGDYVYYDIPVWKHNYQDDIITTYNNIRPIWFCKNPETLPNSKDLDIANYHGVVELTAYPIIKYNGLTLKYTQFSTTQRFPLNTLKNSSDITIADSIYKWSVDNDSCTISFNINGPFINASDIAGRYEIYRINLFNYSSNLPSVDSEPSVNPVSLSNYSVNDTNSKIKHKILTKDSDGNPASFEFIGYNKDPRTKIDTLNTFNFTQKRKLLMCEGNLSNLVLYGQNTINVNWANSNEYYLFGYKNRYTNPDYDSSKVVDKDTNPGWLEDTSFPGYNEEEPDSSYKTIDFSKEGGIYMFRVILEQNGSQLAESKQVLIPSEVFNEWFGSIDNYNEIYLNQWVENYIQNLKVNAFKIFSYDYDIRPETSHAVYAYTLNNKIIQIPINNNISDIFPVSGTNENTNHLFNESQNGTITFIVDYNRILSNLKFSYNKQQNINNGNLYCPLILNNLTLKQGTSEILSGTESIIDSSTMNLENIQILNSEEINLVVQSEPIKKPRIEKVYPFKGLGYGESNQLVILVLHHYQNDRDGVWGQFSYWKNNNETAPIGNGDGAKGQGRVLFDSSVLCADPIRKMNDYGVAYAQFAAKNFANNCGDGSAPNNKGVGELARVDTTDWEGAAKYGTIIAAGDGHGTFDEGTEDGDKFLLFRAYNKASSANNMATVAIQFNSYTAKQTFSKLLEHVYIQEKKDGEDNYYVPKILTTDIELSPNLNITVNKLNVQTIVKLLKVDDCIYMFNTNMFNININSILGDDFDNINLLIAQNNSINNYTQTPNLSISPLTLNFDWLDNDQYNYLYYNLNTEITNYNNISDRQKVSEIYQETFQFDEDAPNQNTLRNICDNKLKFINGVPEINNIAWNVSSWNYTVLRNFRKGGGPGDIITNTALVFMTYIEDFTL